MKEEKEDLSYYYNPKTDDDFIRIAYDYLGNQIRDNSRQDKIEFGKRIHNGTWEDEE